MINMEGVSNMVDRLAVETARSKAEELYRTGQYLCSEAVFLIANEYLGHPVPDNMVRLASGFAVGMGTAGCACGALTGGIMALGIKYGRSAPGVPTPGMFEAAKELHNRFRERHRFTCCRTLIRDFRFGSAEHLQRYISITGEVAADVVELLSVDR